MIKNILWDFDGVILDSMKIKGDGFVELFSGYPQEYLDEIYNFHMQNGGVSRFEKIKYFYDNILKEEIAEEMVIELAEKFGKIISKNLFNKKNLINDTLEFIEKNYKRYHFHVVSGAEHDELNELCKVFEINTFFLSINGSPTDKTTLVKNLLKTNSYKKEETILIGDSLTDCKAAEENGIKFYAYNNENLRGYDYIESFRGLEF